MKWDAYNSDLFTEKIGPIVKGCMEVIEKSGINAYDAKYIPYFLKEEIKANARRANGHHDFKIYPQEEETFLLSALARDPEQTPEQ